MFLFTVRAGGTSRLRHAVNISLSRSDQNCRRLSRNDMGGSSKTNVVVSPRHDDRSQSDGSAVSLQELQRLSRCTHAFSRTNTFRGARLSRRLTGIGRRSSKSFCEMRSGLAALARMPSTMKLNKLSRGVGGAKSYWRTSIEAVMLTFMKRGACCCLGVPGLTAQMKTRSARTDRVRRDRACRNASCFREVQLHADAIGIVKKELCIAGAWHDAFAELDVLVL